MEPLATSFPPWPYYAQEEREAVAEVLHSGRVNYWTGEQCRKFEEEFADYCGVRHAVAVANGTVALESALVALNIGGGDEVIVTPRTFIASASSIILRGARPVFADVDLVSQNLTADTIRAAISERTKAVLLVHLAGWPCDMEPILSLCREKNLLILEDCAQAHGASYRGRRVGSFGDVAAFSFCQDKILSTGGEGGMVTTNHPDRWRAVWSYKDHGKSFDAVYHQDHPPGFRWLHHSLGTNGRMTEIQAAIGRVQLRKLDAWLAVRRGNASRLTQALQSIPSVLCPEVPDDREHAFYKYYIQLRPEWLKPGWDRDRVMAAINAEGVPCIVGSCSEVYLEKAFDQGSYRPERRLPNAARLGETALSFLVHPTIDLETVTRMGSVISKVLWAATVDSV